MGQLRCTEIDVVFSQGRPYEQRVSWPVVQSTDNAWLVQTPAGELWVPSYRWDRMLYGFGTRANGPKLNAVLFFLRDITSWKRDARVEVRLEGKGSSDLTVAYKVGIRGLCGGPVLSAQERTSIVPVSQLQADDDKWTVPRWVVANELGPDEEFQIRPVWPGIQLLKIQLQAAFDAAMAGQIAATAANLKADQEAAERRVERERIAADAKACRQALVDEDGELALAFARQKLTLAELGRLGCRLNGWPRWPRWRPGEPIDGTLGMTLASIVSAVRRHHKFAAWREKNIHRKGALLKPPQAVPPRPPDRVIKNCIVEWCEGGGPASRQRRIDHRDEGCTVEIFGQRHEIELTDGRFIVKMAGPNLKITEPEPARSEATA